MRKTKIIRIRSNFGADTHSVADADTLPTMPRLVGEVMAVVQMAAAVVLGAWLGGAEATAAAAVGMATAGLGWTVVLGRRAAAGMRLVRAAVAEEDVGAEMAQDLERILRADAEERAAVAEVEATRQALLRRIWELEDLAEVFRDEARAERAARRRWSAERVAVGGG